jgi:hypothetical protein
MSEYEILRKNYLQINSTSKTYSPDSNNEFEETIDDRDSSIMIDNNNIIMKTPQSLDDLLDVDDNNNQNEEDKEENENNNNNNDDDDDNDSTHLSVDDPNITEQTRQKKSIEKNGKI